MTKKMFVYSKARALDGTEKVSTGSCATLMQWYTKVGRTSTWREGLKVKGNGNKIKTGTAIATFVDGKYPNKLTGNHAAFYLSQNNTGIWIVDQWKQKSKVTKRFIKYKGKLKDGRYDDPSNNGDAFAAIVHV